MNHTDLRLAVLERDNWQCQVCGRHSAETHHIIGRRNKGAWCIANLITLCPDHHRGNDNAHTHERRKRDLNRLRDKYGYDYTGKGRLWAEALEEHDDK